MIRRSRIKNKKLSEKSQPKQLENALDKLAFDVVLLRDRKCVQCGKTDQDLLTPGHVFGRRVRSSRWSLSNVFVQCVLCNSKHENNRQPFFNWVKAKLGETRFDKLKKEWDNPKKLYLNDLEDMKEKLEKMKTKDAKFFCTLTYDHHDFMHGRCVHCGEIEHLYEKSKFAQENLEAKEWLESEE